MNGDASAIGGIGAGVAVVFATLVTALLAFLVTSIFADNATATNVGGFAGVSAGLATMAYILVCPVIQLLFPR